MTAPSRQDVHLPVGVKVLFDGDEADDSVLQYYVGPTGPQGPQGIPGPRGDVGDTGPRGYVGDTGASGSDGNTLLTGTSDPTPDQGVDGNLFLNITSYTLFGPRADGAWATPGQMLIGATGAQGDRGITGASLLVGVGMPQGGTGNNGDLYIDGNAQLWGPKADGAWPDPTVNLRGVQGDVGPQGDVGMQGEQGERGDVGPTSTVPGPQGEQGIKGDKGDVGDASMVAGPQGQPGIQGAAGLDGTLWFQGDGPPAADNTYPAGSYYYDATNNVIYPPSDS